MIKQTQFVDVYVDEIWIQRQMFLATVITMSAIEIHFVGDILQPVQFEPVFLAAQIQAKKD